MHPKHVKSELKAETESIDTISKLCSFRTSKVTPKLTELDLVYPFSVSNHLSVRLKYNKVDFTVRKSYKLQKFNQNIYFYLLPFRSGLVIGGKGGEDDRSTNRGRCRGIEKSQTTTRSHVPKRQVLR